MFIDLTSFVRPVRVLRSLILRYSEKNSVSVFKGFKGSLLSCVILRKLVKVEKKLLLDRAHPCQEDQRGCNINRLSHFHLNNGKLFNFRSMNSNFFLLIFFRLCVNALFTRVKFDCYYTSLNVRICISIQALSK